MIKVGRGRGGGEPWYDHWVRNVVYHSVSRGA